eukprot:TRINITY_DN751_c1_g1_i1.p1 TRINITY_DN751_c1_g1~~TRINITY_DN751_c1_g1_i1.p1  ORF type:complete len:258 (-),score=-20.66 TRINITY_DN751_c1_g1_i1:1077-1850(-)
MLYSIKTKKYQHTYPVCCVFSSSIYTHILTQLIMNFCSTCEDYTKHQGYGLLQFGIGRIFIAIGIVHNFVDITICNGYIDNINFIYFYSTNIQRSTRKKIALLIDFQYSCIPTFKSEDCGQHTLCQEYFSETWVKIPKQESPAKQLLLSNIYFLSKSSHPQQKFLPSNSNHQIYIRIYAQWIFQDSIYNQILLEMAPLSNTQKVNRGQSSHRHQNKKVITINETQSMCKSNKKLNCKSITTFNNTTFDIIYLQISIL